MSKFDFEIVNERPSRQAVIKVVGVGGAGGNAINHMIDHGIKDVEFVSANTDAQALSKSKASLKLQLGESVTRGLGGGGRPERGRDAAIESAEDVAGMLDGSDMVFIAAGMGGATGTGAGPVVAEMARERGILTVAVVTRPFSYEGNKRAATAEQGIEELSRHVDSLIIISNDRLAEIMEDASVQEAFLAADNVLYGAVRGIADLITQPGKINVDFADVREVMSSAGNTIIGSGVASGKDAAQVAVDKAIQSPLLDSHNLDQAAGILFNITAGNSFKMSDMSLISEKVGDLGDDANIIMGLLFDKSLKDEVRVTVVATGFNGSERGEAVPVPGLAPKVVSSGAVVKGKGQAARIVRRVGKAVGYDEYDTPPFLCEQAD